VNADTRGSKVPILFFFVVIKIRDRLKTSRIRKSQPLLIFKQIIDMPLHFLLKLFLKLYFELTRELPDTSDLLFISYCKSYKPVSLDVNT